MDEPRVPRLFDPSSPFAIVENHRAPEGARASHLFWSPEHRVEAHDPAEIPIALDRLRACTDAGLFVCGYVTYEAGYFIVAKARFRLSKAAARTLPLVGFFAFSRHEQLDGATVDSLLRSMGGDGPSTVRHVALGEDEERHRSKVERIRAYIAGGDAYQVNHTFKCRLHYEGSAARLYAELRRRQPVPYGTYLAFPEAHVISLSPELFVRKDGEKLTAKPMKGTARRGATPGEDEAIVSTFRADPKTQAENVMIVDLLRSDVGRLAVPGSVAVHDLFAVETFETVHQMTSTVTGTVPAGLSIGEAFAGLFPCGSITGAPKIRTMQIIEELEDEPRGVYTGALGYGMPNGDFCFSVPIRTLVSTVEGSAELGIGSGILHESDAAAEYEECLLKARFVTGKSEQLHLIESLRFDASRGPSADLPRHFARLEASARVFGFRYDHDRVMAAMAAATDGAAPGGHKLRLLLGRDGAPSITLARLDDDADTTPRRLIVSPLRVDSRSLFRYHKTTVRELCDREFARVAALGCYEVLFLNERDEVAECSRHNVFVEIDGELLTPPLSAGVLAGIRRAVVLADPAARAREAVLYADDLRRADRIFLTNAVRGVVEVELDSTGRARSSTHQEASSPP